MAGTGGDVDRVLSRTKRGLGIDVLTAAQRRIKRVFTDFPVVYVSFSGGKDSGVLLELAAVEARARGRRLGCLVVDLEAQYSHTITYLHQMLDRHADVLDVYWVCLPLNLRNAVSHLQPQWTCWDPDVPDAWVRPLPTHPGVISDPTFFEFFSPRMEFEDFVPQFGQWLSDRHGGRMTACLVGIRSDESLNRYRTVANRKKDTHDGLQWTTWIKAGGALYNAYPIYDWRTEDVWRYYGKTKTPYNLVYDLMHKAGLSIHQARLCQPYGDDQKKGLWLYHMLEPRTWGKLVARVQGANFGARYARETGNITGRITITCPPGLTWEAYAESILASLPHEVAEHYRNRIAWFINWHCTKGIHRDGVIPDDGPLDKKHASWKRICKVLLTYDYWTKGLTFSPPANLRSYEEYKKRMKIRREEWNKDWGHAAL